MSQNVSTYMVKRRTRFMQDCCHVLHCLWQYIQPSKNKDVKSVEPPPYVLTRSSSQPALLVRLRQLKMGSRSSVSYTRTMTSADVIPKSCVWSMSRTFGSRPNCPDTKTKPLALTA
mgnify:CR=1 FL=1